VTNEVIIVLALIALIVLAARKWDTLKWFLGLGFVVLAIYTAISMGMADKYIPDVKTPTVDFK
jgi:membrane protein implicated in regulation of membrane protease activity